MTAPAQQPQPRDGAATSDSLATAMRELRCRPRHLWLDLARQDQSDRWRTGRGVRAEEYFWQLPELRADTEEAMVLICGEAMLRRELAGEPSLEEYQQRFPEFAADLIVQFDVSLLFDSQPDWLGLEDDSDQELELPGYEFLDEIGRGASGIVYKARQQSLNRLVAVKVLANPAGDEKRPARQRQEAELLARLQHPNVVHVYEVAHHHGRVYLVMELIEGPTLRERTKGRPWQAGDSAEMVRTLADAVHAVHEAGILHRDLKPSNVLLTPTGQPKISDFGLAKRQVDGNISMTYDSIVGTPSYMSPEQAAGDSHHVSSASDVYSLGAILYELLTGRPPFMGVTVLDTLSMIRTSDPVPLRSLQPKTPRDLETICLKSLFKNPKHRYATAKDLADDLRRFLAGEPILARRTTHIERFGRFVKRNPAAFVALALFAALVLVLAMAKWRMDVQEHRLASAGLIDAVATTDPQLLPQLVGRLASQSEHALPLLKNELQLASVGDSKWVNLSVAQLAMDPQASGRELLNYLPSARVNEVQTIVEVLADRADDLQPELWQRLVDESATDDGRLRLACLAAQISSTDARWSEVAKPVARALVRQHPLDIATFTSSLNPARQSLVPALVELIRESKLEPLARRSAISIVARFATGQVETLVDLIVEAEPDEFVLLFPALERQPEAALPRLRDVLSNSVSIKKIAALKTWTSPHEIERTYDAAERRRAVAAVAIWRLGDTAPVLNSIADRANPELRAWIIELLTPLGAQTEQILKEQAKVSNPVARQALLLALGQARVDGISQKKRQQVVDQIVEILTSDPDPGIHAACRWLLGQRFDAEPRVAKSNDAQSTARRNWYIGPNGHSFSVIQIPATFKTGSPPNELWREDDEVSYGHEYDSQDRTVAFAMHEVTVKQYLRFRETSYNPQYSPAPDCPINNITWFDAAAYCRWLSEQANIPEDQMVYPPVDEIKPGMKLPANWLARSGYRLPTEREWEYACRAGTTTSRFCGAGSALVPEYAWCLPASDDHSWPVGRLKPNQIGLFDILGNVAERCHRQGPERVALDSPETAAPYLDQIIEAHLEGNARGGEFADLTQNLRAARRYSIAPAQAPWGTVGFRVVRTVHWP